MGEEFKPEIKETTIDCAGDSLYEYIVEKSTSQKLVVCCKFVEEMDEVRNMILKQRKHKAVKKKVITFDPEGKYQGSTTNWKLIKALDENDVDIVVTWEVGARSINYWKQCTVVALFIFDQERELR